MSTPAILSRVKRTSPNDQEISIYGHTIYLTEDHSDNVSGMIWDATLIMLEYFRCEVGLEHFKGKKVLELGAGLGLVGITLATAGAEVTMTDMKHAVPTIERNIELNRGTWEKGGGSARALMLEWGQEGYERSEIAKEPMEYDIIIACECVYEVAALPWLKWTMERIYAPTTWMIMEERSFLNLHTDDDDFVFNSTYFIFDLERCKDNKGEPVFDVKEITDVDTMGKEDIYMHKLTRRSPRS